MTLFTKFLIVFSMTLLFMGFYFMFKKDKPTSKKVGGKE